MKIGVDLDDVLLDFNRALCAYHNREHGTSYLPEQVTSYNLDAIWGCGPEEAVERVLAFYQSPDHFEAGPITGAVEAITRLSQDHILYVVSAKPDTLRPMTLAWLDKHFPDRFEGVHFTNHYHGENKRTKAQVCSELKIETFVEDSMTNARNIADAGVPVFLLDKPWNQGDPGPLVTRVSSWDEIVKKIEQ